MNTGTIEATPTGIWQVIEEDRLVIRNHQRHSSRTVHEVRRIIDDIREALNCESAVCFLGHMLFWRTEEGTSLVLDGQPRLLAVIVLQSAVLGWLNNHLDDRRKLASIDRKLVGDEGFGESTSLRYWTNGQERNDGLPDLIVVAHECVNEIADSFPNAVEATKYLLHFLEYLRTTATILRVRVVCSEADAMMILETIGEQGIDLEPTDLALVIKARGAA